MSKKLTAWAQLKQAFPEPDWRLVKVGTGAAEVYYHGHFVCIVAAHPISGRWAGRREHVESFDPRATACEKYGHSTPWDAAYWFAELHEVQPPLRFMREGLREKAR